MKGLEIKEVWFYISNEDHEYNAKVLKEEIGDAYNRNYEKELKHAKKGFKRLNKINMFSAVMSVLKSNISYTSEIDNNVFKIYPVFFTTASPNTIPYLIMAWNNMVVPTIKKKFQKYFDKVEIKTLPFSEGRHIVDVYTKKG